MATQGTVSVVKEGVVRMKIVAGSNGFHAKVLADWLRANPGTTAQDAFDKASAVGFGSEDDLIVQSSPSEFISNNGIAEVPPLYQVHFFDPIFNPRWSHGTADHVEIVNE